MSQKSEGPEPVADRLDMHAACSRAGYDAARAGLSRIINPYATPPPFPCVADPPRRRSMAAAWLRGWQRGWRDRLLGGECGATLPTATVQR